MTFSFSSTNEDKYDQSFGMTRKRDHEGRSRLILGGPVGIETSVGKRRRGSMGCWIIGGAVSEAGTGWGCPVQKRGNRK